MVQERKLQDKEGERWTCGREVSEIRVRRREIAREGQVEVGAKEEVAREGGREMDLRERSQEKGSRERG